MSPPPKGAWVALVLLTTAAIVVPALGARAHEGEPGFRPRLVAVQPDLRGLTVEVRQVLAPTLTVRNSTGTVVEVVGDDGVPFLRIGPEAVQANVASADFFRSEFPSPLVPVAATAGAPPRFVTIADGAEWSWFEHRISSVARGAWTVDLLVGGRPVEVHGDWEGVEVPGSFAVTVDGPSPAVEGLRIVPLQGAVPGLFVDNPTGRTLEIPGPRGDPFLRIGPDVTERADGAGGWAQVSSAARYGWTDPRIGWPAGEELPAELRTARSPRTVGTWTLDLTLGGRPLTLSGTLRWVPVAAHHDGGSPPVVLLAGGVTGLAALALALAVRARRQARPAGEPA